MTLRTTRKIFLLAAVAAVAAAPLGAAPAFAQDRGVAITIQKGPSYLNTRQTPKPGSATRAAYDTSAVYQPFQSQRNSISFSRYPLPSSFTLPGY
ncbi:hypothetical protein [Chenggangzhangella methanolivorans]|uniref:Uncharacterized protein n=1 Tax=Chenggangzhangella methanolivorans TaxID=1437009 RepID=A0A9E6RBV6_9HYPH|nr:hypothetical protein [Chenggangzhangella methanolivorans]QZN98235.1 hypothetical protein K6K41_13815 [Chenggangzhangella methanolivorans]